MLKVTGAADNMPKNSERKTSGKKDLWQRCEHKNGTGQCKRTRENEWEPVRTLGERREESYGKGKGKSTSEIM